MTNPSTEADNAADLTRERILDAAEQCVRRFGIKRTVMGDVASKSKVSRATLYNHFEDKNSLVDALLIRTQQRFCDEGRRHIDQFPSLKERVSEAVIWSRKQMGGELFLNISETEPDTAAAMALEGEHIKYCMTFWPDYVQQAIDNGEVRKDLDIEKTASWIQQMILSLLIFPHLTQIGESAEEIADFIGSYLFAGLEN